MVEPLRLPGKPAWLEINVQRAHLAQTFYTSFFGWRTKPMHHKPLGMMPLFDNGRGEFANGFMAMGAFAPPQWVCHVSGNPDEVAERVAQHGGKVLAEPHDNPGWGRITTFDDPEGTRLNVILRDDGDLADPSKPGDAHTLELWATDAQAMGAFYAESLGLDITSTERGQTLAHGGTPRLFVRTCPFHPPPARWIPYFRTASLGADRRRAQLFGAIPQVEPEELPGLGQVELFADPAGAVFGLLELAD